MPELGPILERESRSVRLPDDAFDGMLRRRDRKRRNRRIGAAVTALAIAASLVAGAATAVLDRSQIKPGTEPVTAQNVASLHEVWRAHIGDAPTPVLTDGIVANANKQGQIQAFREDCATDGSTCPPLWTAEIGTVNMTTDQFDGTIEWWPGASDQPNAGLRLGSLTAADGSFYALAADQTLYAFPAACRSDGGVCSPLWTASTQAGDLPMVSSGLVFATGIGGIAAYKVGCATDGSACDPVWKRSLAGPVRLQGDRLYVNTAVGAGPGPVGFVKPGDVVALDLRTGATLRDSGSLPSRTRCCGNTPTPVQIGDSVYVNFGHLLAAFPADCTDRCDPVWTIRIPDKYSDGPLLAGDTLVISTAENTDIGGMWFIPLACASPGSGCEKGKRVQTTSEQTTHPPVSSGSQVFATSRRGTGYWTFDTACASLPGDCHTIGYSLLYDTIAPDIPVVAGDVVFVADESSGLHAFAANCTGSCKPLWSATAMLPSQEPLVDGARVFSMDALGTLHAYETGGPIPAAADSTQVPHSPGLAPFFYLGLAIVIGGVYVIRRRRTTR